MNISTSSSMNPGNLPHSSDAFLNIPLDSVMENTKRRRQVLLS